MSWHKSLFVSRESRFESVLRKRFTMLLQPYKRWLRVLRQRHRWLFEALRAIAFLPLVSTYILIGVLGLIEVATRSSEAERGVLYPYYSRYWDAIGGIARFDKEVFYEIWYWTAGISLLFGLFLLYALLKKDRDLAYE